MYYFFLLFCFPFFIYLFPLLSLISFLFFLWYFPLYFLFFLFFQRLCSFFPTMWQCNPFLYFLFHIFLKISVSVCFIHILLFPFYFIINYYFIWFIYLFILFYLLLSLSSFCIYLIIYLYIYLSIFSSMLLYSLIVFSLFSFYINSSLSYLPYLRKSFLNVRINVTKYELCHLYNFSIFIFYHCLLFLFYVEST